MDQEKNNLLLEDLMETKGSFDIIIMEMQDRGIDFPYEKLIKMVETGYVSAYNSITKMKGYTEEYIFLEEENSDFFNDEARIIIGGIFMYITTFLILRIFGKMTSSKQINEIYYMLIGLLFGSYDMGYIYSSINNHRNSSKESRELINRMKSLKEDYKMNLSIVENEIDTIRSICRNLWHELDSYKRKEISL